MLLYIVGMLEIYRFIQQQYTQRLNNVNRDRYL